jgi:tRNA threonylcarbamoyladenosine biosynthesis protein TsaE
MTTSAVEFVLHSESADATVAIGRALGELAEPGLVVALVGPLGAGKTQFVRGLAAGLGVADSRAVSSPTFVLIQEYAGRLPIFHFDTYRLSRPEQFAELGPHEYFEGDGVSLVEWADRVVDSLPSQRLDVRFTIKGEHAREVHFAAPPLSREAAILQRLQQKLSTALH